MVSVFLAKVGSIGESKMSQNLIFTKDRGAYWARPTGGRRYNEKISQIFCSHLNLNTLQEGACFTKNDYLRLLKSIP